jgi:thiol-disulfide isomerase/thioredoxin
MMQRKWMIVGLVALFAICGAVAATVLYLNANRQPPIGTNIGDTAPSFTLENLDGTPISLSDYHGHVVILEFWQTSCPDCRAAMPHLRDLYSQYKDAGLVWVGVNLNHDPEITRTYLKDNGFLDQITLWQSFDDAMDTQGRTPMNRNHRTSSPGCSARTWGLTLFLAWRPQISFSEEN